MTPTVWEALYTIFNPSPTIDFIILCHNHGSDCLVSFDVLPMLLKDDRIDAAGMRGGDVSLAMSGVKTLELLGIGGKPGGAGKVAGIVGGFSVISVDKEYQ